MTAASGQALSRKLALPWWKRALRPESRWPCRYTRVAPFWHPWHIGAACARLRMRYLGWRGY